MKVVVISPPDDRADEIAVVRTLFSAGLERYHLRKPGWDQARVRRWLASLPRAFRPQIFVHGHPEIAARFGVGGIHFPDADAPGKICSQVRPSCATSRSCHDVVTLQARLGGYDSLLFGPVFSSLSKPGYGPTPAPVLEKLGATLRSYGCTEMRTRVFAVGGIRGDRVSQCAALGFDGVAVLGAVWGAADPGGAFREILRAAGSRAQGASREVQP